MHVPERHKKDYAIKIPEEKGAFMKKSVKKGNIKSGKTYDLIVVGAGSGGCVAAICALKMGLKVCLIDKKEDKKIGDKTCGDLIGLKHIEFLERKIGIRYPKKDMECIVDKSETSILDDKISFLINEKGCMLNRHHFGQFLLENAKKFGAELIANKRVTSPIIEDNFVRGIIFEDNRTGKEEKIYGKIIIDASGVIPALRDKIKLKGTYLENNIHKSNFTICIRQVRTLKKDIKFKHPKLIISERYAKGGYIWIFPYNKNRVNIGLGMSIKRNIPNLNKLLEDFIASCPMFKGSKINDSGGGIVPTRRPLDSMVSNGFMVIGDAAVQVNPLTGGGIGQSMLAGYISAHVAYEAIRKNDFSQEALWDYNLRFTKFNKYSNDIENDYYDGIRQSSFDVIRHFYKSFTDEELSYIFKNYIDNTNFKRLSMGGKVSINLKFILKTIQASIKKPRIFLKLLNMILDIRHVSGIYRNYPETPEGFQKWKERLDRQYQHINKHLR